MNFTGYEITLILFIHWIADFILQSHWQASNKSKRWDVLLGHTVTYSAWIGFMLYVGFLISSLVFNQTFIYETTEMALRTLVFIGVTFVAHTITDYFTSRWTGKLYAKGDIHNFFMVVGFDQLLHFAQLFLTYHILFR